jgi:magnesium chelatase family protein
MLATARTAGLVGVDAVPVTVEADVPFRGVGGFHLVGLVETAVRESQVRIFSALINSGYRRPPGRVTVSLAPADLPKGGSGYDLPIALALLAASGVVAPAALARFLVVGELSLQGDLRPVRGALSYAMCARHGRDWRLIMPSAMAQQAAAVPGVEAAGADSLAAAVAVVRGEIPWEPMPPRQVVPRVGRIADLADVRGQETARRALEIAAAGGHHLLTIGPPGTGKSMLAARLPSILPPLSREESLATSAIWSVAGLLDGEGVLRDRPLRAPHHTASDVGLVGGGAIPRPGELSLAHNGVLFLDELPEFRPRVLESLRQPLEQGVVVVVRARQQVTFPARVQLVATMNPCPCGHHGQLEAGSCQCSPDQVRRYRSRISGPLLDRIDLQVEVPALSLRRVEELPPGETSATIRERVMAARQRQQARLEPWGLHCNAEMTPAAVREHCPLGQRALDFLVRAGEQRQLSLRGVDRVRKLARTIADLDERETLNVADVAEALSLRALDRPLS